MRRIARRLIAEEHPPADSADTEGQPAFRVCEKLGRSLSALAGMRGFRTLLTRALTLAVPEVPWLAKVTVRPDGSLALATERQEKLDRKEAIRGGEALVTHLLELLVTFIGEALTLRLVQQVWPKAVLNDSQ